MFLDGIWFLKKMLSKWSKLKIWKSYKQWWSGFYALSLFRVRCELPKGNIADFCVIDDDLYF